MNWRVDEEGYFKVWCHGCKQELDLIDLIRVGETGVHCVFCGTHLGYVHDIPEKFRKLLGW